MTTSCGCLCMANRDGNELNEAQSVLWRQREGHVGHERSWMQEDFNQVTLGRRGAPGYQVMERQWLRSVGAPPMGSTLQRAEPGWTRFKTLSDPVNDRETRYVYDAAGGGGCSRSIRRRGDPSSTHDRAGAGGE